MKLDAKTILLTIAALIVMAGAYWYFFTGTGNEPSLTTTDSQNQAQLQFKTLVGELQPISFDTSIFSDPRFMALVDLATPIAPETSGRLDPFAPVSGISGK
ncbi:hypothetical protein HY972_01990 [Candidatus Kaiserbacteria bacterium]|nr:hypothetical protein [Candidatus Kaiserbacteria bacterium]